MSVGVGVIGAGVMGADHARIIASHTSGAHLAAVADADLKRAQAVAGNALALSDPLELIAEPTVGAVIVASPDETHHKLVLAAIASGKPVLCEKPLAVDLKSCLEIVDAEKRSGRSLVQTGFMRRFDPTYADMKSALRGGEIGDPRIVHFQHRNAAAPAWFTSAMAITNAFVHEIDIARWLLEDEFVSGSVLPFRGQQKGAVGDPLMFLLETKRGTILSGEVFMNSRYGYHVHAEVVCESGTVVMAPPALTRVRKNGSENQAFSENWIPRFADAYRRQNQAWVDALQVGKIADGASSAWDGLVATCIAEQLVTALKENTRVSFMLPSAS